MSKGLTIFAMVISVLVLVLFALDLIANFAAPAIAPFRGASVLLDSVFVVSALGLGYISWSTFRELK